MRLLKASSQAPVVAAAKNSVTDTSANVGGPTTLAKDAPTGTAAYAYAAGQVNFANLGPNVAKQFNSSSMITFGSGALGANYAPGATGEQTYTGSIEWVLDPKTAGLPSDGHLYLGLVDQVASGAAFSKFAFSLIENGFTLLTKTFTSLTEAKTFFTDRVLDLGAWKDHIGGSSVLDLTVSFSATFKAAGGYGVNFVFGDPPPSVPEPGTLALLGVGGLWRRRGQKAG